MTVDWYIALLALCGIPMQMWVGWKFGKFLTKVGWSAIAAGSVCHWGFNVGKVHGFKSSKWRWIPGLFFTEWWAFLTSPYDSITSSCHGGVWVGIGNWAVYPKPLDTCAAKS